MWEDSLTQVYPFRVFAAVSLAKGELPLWNPYVFGGMPFQADIQSALFYLPNLLLTLFVSDGRLSHYAIEVMLVAHYWLAGVTMYHLAKELALEPIYALFSGLVFALSGFIIGHAIHPGFVQQVAWFPLIVLLLHRSLRLHSASHAILAGLVLGHAILAGAPQISLYLAFFLLLFFVFLFTHGVRERGFRSNLPKLALGGGMVVAAAGIAAIQLLPTLELIPLSERATMTFEGAQEGRLFWSHLLAGVIPKLFGAAGAREATYWGPGDYGAYWETSFYLGIPGLIVAAIAVSQLRTNRYIAFLVGTVLFAFLLAVGDQFILHRIFFEVVPGFDNFRAIARILVYVVFAGALLAGFGLRALVDLTSRAPRTMVQLLVGAGGTIVGLCLLVWLGVFQPAPNSETSRLIRDYASHQAVVAALLALAVCAVGLLLVRTIIPPSIAIAALLVIQVADVMLYGFKQNNGVASAEEYYDLARARIGPILADNKREYFRLVVRSGSQVMIERNQGMLDGLFLVEGYTPLALKHRIPPAKNVERTYDLLNAKYRIIVDTVREAMAFRRFDSYLPRAFVVHDAVVIPDSASTADFMKRDAFDPRRTVVLQEPPATPIPDDSVSARAGIGIRSYQLNSIEINVVSPAAGMLVLSEIYYPGWNAYVDGAPAKVHRADWVLRAVPIPAGAHLVELRFEPASFRRGAWITALTLVLAIGALVWPRVRRRAGVA